MAKLTLNADAETIEKAKRLAAERHTSVSALFSRFIRVLANGAGSDMPIGKIAKKASGMIDLKGRDYRDVLTDSLRDKYRL
ncbi:MAG TPA: DUF6364 family protein [Sedimentisphaerales bacterium]|nr:DUF6364 family protein [Sedimentisphaerales bacterium]HRS09829.1 DUF6364 family protein [Sedimentisphaerales bacterium]HRV46521.1 DUF6364 family protein [Sedimentisphaerales bacterium]